MASPVHARPLLTVGEVADRLGVSTRTVRRRIESGELPAVRLGSSRQAPVRIDADELDGWLYRIPLTPGSRGPVGGAAKPRPPHDGPNREAA
jgi:excisionase family DNA binding protein